MEAQWGVVGTDSRLTVYHQRARARPELEAP